MARPDLVQEREGARVPLERDAHEVAHRDLDLRLDRLREPERRDGLDIEPLIRLEQLERLQRQGRPPRRRP